MVRLLAHLFKLPLKNLNLLTLISDFGRTFLQISLDDFIISKLRLHVYLGTPSLACWFQNVDTPTLGSYEREKTV